MITKLTPSPSKGNKDNDDEKDATVTNYNSNVS